MNTELSVDLFEVAVDRVVGDIQAGSDLLVPQALREEIEDVQLAVSQLFAVSSSSRMFSIEFRWRGFAGPDFAIGKTGRGRTDAVHKVLDPGKELIFSGKPAE